MKNVAISIIVGVACLTIGFFVGGRLKSGDYMHGHTDGLLAGVFEEYNRVVVKDTTQMDADALANHNSRLDFLERRIDGIFSSDVQFSPELEENWVDLKAMRKPDA